MVRRILLVLAVLAMTLAVASPALADRPPDKGKPPGKPEGAGAAGAVAAPVVGKAFQGVIKSIDGDIWTVTVTGHGDQATSVQVNVANAKVKWPGLKSAAIGSFQTGDRVAIKLQSRATTNQAQSATPEQLKAREIHIIPGKTFAHFGGEVTAVGGGKLTLKSDKGDSKTFTVTDATPVQLGKVIKPFAQTGTDGPKVGDRATVVYRTTDTSAEPAALAIRVHNRNDTSSSQQKG